MIEYVQTTPPPGDRPLTEREKALAECEAIAREYDKGMDIAISAGESVNGVCAALDIADAIAALGKGEGK